MLILIDMDGVIADFERGFIAQWKKIYPKNDFIPLHKRSTRRIFDQYPANMKELVEGIYHQEGFIRSLHPIPKSIDSLNKMLDIGYDVFICSTPLDHFTNCVQEKYEWVNEHMGFDWTKRIILTKDKTLIRAEVLIDDDPEIKGIMRPEWERIIYDQPWNKRLAGKRLTGKTGKKYCCPDNTETIKNMLTAGS